MLFARGAGSPSLQGGELPLLVRVGPQGTSQLALGVSLGFPLGLGLGHREGGW